MTIEYSSRSNLLGASIATCLDIYMPERPQTTAANEKLKLAASIAHPMFTMKGSPCRTEDTMSATTVPSLWLLS